MKALLWTAPLVILVVTSSAWSIDFPLSRIKIDEASALTQEELSSRLACDPVLISRRVDESGFGKEFRVSYGGYDFLRTDVGNPNGWLTVTHGKDALCRIELSLNVDIYFSAKNKVLVLTGTNGSQNNFEAFDVKQDCTYLGTLKAADPEEVMHLLDSDDPTRICKDTP